jgi:hypothetical protein
VLRISGSNPLMLAPMLRREITRTRPGFLVSRIVAQTELVEQQTIRERLLAMLASFFLPPLVLFAAALLASVPAAIRAVRIDPVEMLRTE